MEQAFDIETCNRLIRTRRSVFTDQFTQEKKIPDQLIREILLNATCAPTHKKTEPWRFVVFTGNGLKKLADFQSALYRETAGDKFKQEKYEKLLTTPLKCSHILSIGMKRSIEVNIPETEEIAAVACAVQNIYLSVNAYGLGGYWSTGGITYEPLAKEFFGLSPADKLLGFFYLGYVQNPSPLSSRTPVDERVIWVND